MKDKDCIISQQYYQDYLKQVKASTIPYGTLVGQIPPKSVDAIIAARQALDVLGNLSSDYIRAMIEDTKAFGVLCNNSFYNDSWVVEIDKLLYLNAEAIKFASNDAVTKLLTTENRTAKLLELSRIDNRMVSAATQLSSIYGAYGGVSKISLPQIQGFVSGYNK